MSEIKVIGHTPPDTDSICSPIAYAWYLAEMKNMSAKAYITGDIGKESEYVLQRFGFNIPEKISQLNENDRYCLLDTNNPDELVPGYQSAKLIEIIDHHKIAGGLSTAEPIEVNIKPVACTATIIFKKMKMDGIVSPPQKIAGLMLAAIISDTLKFRSPTTTDEDKMAAEMLGEIAEIDIDELAQSMFEAKSDLSGMSPKDILLSDSKVYDLTGKKVRVSVLETTIPDKAKKRLADFKQTMKTIKDMENLNMFFFYIVDILNSSSDLIVENNEEKSTAEKAYNSIFSNGLMHLEGVVSRKKQMVPNIENALKK